MEHIILIMIILEVIIAVLLVMIFFHIKSKYFRDIKKEKRVYNILNYFIRKRGFKNSVKIISDGFSRSLSFYKSLNKYQKSFMFYL